MAMTEQELKLALDNEETRYPEIVARLDESDIPLVRAFAQSDDVALASKAVYLASLIEASSAQDIVADAARSSNELIRVASATALANLPVSAREKVAASLIDDANPAVSKLVLRAIEAPSPGLVGKIRKLQQRSPHPEIRELAKEKLKNE